MVPRTSSSQGHVVWAGHSKHCFKFITGLCPTCFSASQQLFILWLLMYDLENWSLLAVVFAKVNWMDKVVLLWPKWTACSCCCTLLNPWWYHFVPTPIVPSCVPIIVPIWHIVSVKQEFDKVLQCTCFFVFVIDNFLLLVRHCRTTPWKSYWKIVWVKLFSVLNVLGCNIGWGPWLEQLRYKLNFQKTSSLQIVAHTAPNKKLYATASFSL